ncbi:oligosaccharide flippase family protein [candidate division WWE3 bacterium]|nr:oligosaccharide flippase family protein [candidate division WWE3 bacterium]
MNELSKWQIVSLASRFTAVFLGLVQSVVIARILSVEEFGVIGVVGAVGSLAGIASHLGLASGTTREISASSAKDDVFKIALSSLAIKYAVTFPLALGLFLAAPYLADKVYKIPQIALPIKLYAVVLVVQGVQSIFNSVIAGLHKFQKLFTFQVMIAFISLLLYVPLVQSLKVNGYFYALVLFNLVSSISLGFLAIWPIRDSLRIPTRNEFSGIFKNILLLSIAIYFAKVLYTVWFKIGQLTLGYVEALEAVGVFSFAILYASKLQTVSDAITDVNLPYFSKQYSLSLEEFKKSFHENFIRLYLIILFIAVSAVYWSSDVILIVGLEKYQTSVDILLPLALAFAFYSLVNLLKSSIFVPAKLMRELVISYLALPLVTVFAYLPLALFLGSLRAVSYAMLLGSFGSFMTMYFLIKTRFSLSLIDLKSLGMTFLIFSLIPAIFLPASLTAKALVYLGFFVVLLVALDKMKVLKLQSLLQRLR